MNQQTHGDPQGSQSSPPNHNNAGVEGLMNSLISPGPSTPGQGPFGGPWLGLSDWPNAFQNNFGTINGYTQLSDGENFQKNGMSEYAPYESFSSQAEKNSAKHRIESSQKPSNNSDQQVAPAAPQVDQAEVPNKTQAPNTIPITDKVAAAENAKRLNDLRARLLASRSKEQRGLTPNDKTKENGTTRMLSAGVSPKTIKKNSPLPKPSKLNDDQSKTTVSGTASSQLPSVQEKGVITDLEQLVNEVKNEAKIASNDLSGDTQAVETPIAQAKPEAYAKVSGIENIPHRPSPRKQAASPELSEGEIRSDEDRAPAPPACEPLKKPQVRKESLDSEEKSRRESEVEAAYKKTAAPSRESQEKLRRQSQVDLAYSPLRKSSGNSTKSGKLPLDTQLVHRKLSNLNKEAPKSAVETPSRPWDNHAKPRAAEYDSYVPAYRKPTFNEKSFDVQNSTASKDHAASGFPDAEDRRRAIEKNERAAKEYKRALEEARPQASRVISHTDTTYLGRIEDNKSEPINGTLSGREAPSAMVPLAHDDPDVRDWLELTDFHNEEHRGTMLAIFRKRKELDRLQLQLVEEEQRALRKHSILRASGFGNESSPKIAKMPAPPLTLRDTNHSNGAIRTAVIPAETQVTIPTLKRQAEVNTDARTKFPRIETRVDDDLARTKDEDSPLIANQLPLEHRISRDDGHVGSRYRRRSHERSRRRSTSPEFRRKSVPDFARQGTCHNCGESGHYQTTCTVPRRDGKDRYRAPQPKARFDGVSSAYLGKNPIKGFQDPRALGYNASNRSIDDEDRRP